MGVREKGDDFRNLRRREAAVFFHIEGERVYRGIVRMGGFANGLLHMENGERD